MNCIVFSLLFCLFVVVVVVVVDRIVIMISALTFTIVSLRYSSYSRTLLCVIILYHNCSPDSVAKKELGRRALGTSRHFSVVASSLLILSLAEDNLFPLATEPCNLSARTEYKPQTDSSQLLAECHRRRSRRVMRFAHL